MSEVTIDFAPVVYPTMEEFSNPEKYLQYLEDTYSKDNGMVKIVPPKEWKARTEDYEQSIEKNMIPNPIEQNLYGKGGVYECLHIIKKSMQVKEYVKRSKKFDSITQGKSIEQVENLFWKNIAFSPPLYGSDFQDSLFDKGVVWNLTELKSLLNDGVDSQMSGITVPYLYMGHWKTMFCWHKEDLDLGALNYLHYGKTKFWYSVPADQGHLIEKQAKIYFAENFTKCSEHLRHKTVVMNPYVLKKKYPQLKIKKINHEANELIVVFSGAYHHGFNFGFNIAESVNYATLNWLPHFLTSKPCKCQRGHAKINHMEFYLNLIKSRPQLQDSQIVQQFYKDMIEKKLDQEYIVKQQQEEEDNKMSEETHNNEPNNNINMSNSTNATKQAINDQNEQEDDDYDDEYSSKNSKNDSKQKKNSVSKSKVQKKKIRKNSSFANNYQKNKQEHKSQHNSPSYSQSDTNNQKPKQANQSVFNLNTNNQKQDNNQLDLDLFNETDSLKQNDDEMELDDNILENSSNQQNNNTQELNIQEPLTQQKQQQYKDIQHNNQQQTYFQPQNEEQMQQQQQQQNCQFKQCDDNDQQIQLVQQIRSQVPQLQENELDLIKQIQERINKEKQQLQKYYPNKQKNIQNTQNINKDQENQKITNIDNNNINNNNFNNKQNINQHNNTNTINYQQNTSQNQNTQQEKIQEEQQLQDTQTILQQQLQQKIDLYKIQSKQKNNNNKNEEQIPSRKNSNKKESILKSNKKSKKEKKEYDNLSSDSSSEYKVQEDWLQCDSCQKWRKIMDRRKLKRRKYFYCSYLENIDCNTREESLEEDYKILKKNY